MTRLALAALLALLAAPAQAHRASDGFLTLAVDGERVSGRLEIALRDAALLAPLDADGDGQLTWGELRRGEPALRAAVEPALALRADGATCELALGELLLNDRSDGPYAWLPLQADCPTPPAELAIDYRAMFDIDPGHRGLLSVTRGGEVSADIFEPRRQRIVLRFGEPGRLRQFVAYVREGVHHIWIGADHVLFLVSLLLPCVLLWRDGGWRPAATLRPVLWDVLRVVTAFTLAHSVTLTLSALAILRLPSAPVETAIAISVLCAALNNLRPLVGGRRWVAAFGFGLVHGFGFATVLGEMGLPEGARVLALAGFNIGVELGQLAIVALAVPAAFAVRRRLAYVRVMQAGSAAAAVVALGWALQRSGLWA